MRSRESSNSAEVSRSAMRAGWRRTVPMPLIGGFALFLAVIVALVIPPLFRRSALTFDPTPPGEGRSARTAWPVDTVTVDASDATWWRFLSLAQGEILTPPDTAGWVLAVRRLYIISADATADLGPVEFDAVERAPAGGYVRTIAATDTTNAALRRWYDYSMLTHLLKSRRHVYVVRTRDGRYAKAEVLSYYCTGLKPGCLTFRYAYPVAER
jgi:hypothetical protein